MSKALLRSRLSSKTASPGVMQHCFHSFVILNVFSDRRNSPSVGLRCQLVKAKKSQCQRVPSLTVTQNEKTLCRVPTVGASVARHLLINLRIPRDYVGLPFFRSFTLSPLDGASVREAHCAQATVARLVTFESLEIFFCDQQRIVYLGSLLYLYVRCRHRSVKSTAVLNKTFLFQVTNIYLFCGSVTLST